MTSQLNISKFCSKRDQLIEVIEQLIALEFSRTGSPWVSKHRLCELFSIGYGLDLEALVESRSYGSGFKSWLVGSRRFCIYNTPQPRQYYVALVDIVMPGRLRSGQPRPRLRSESP